MKLFPHETIQDGSKKRFVWKLCDLHWFAHRSEPGRSDIRAAYGETDSSLETVDSYLSEWRAHMRSEQLL